MSKVTKIGYKNTNVFRLKEMKVDNIKLLSRQSVFSSCNLPFLLVFLADAFGECGFLSEYSWSNRCSLFFKSFLLIFLFYKIMIKLHYLSNKVYWYIYALIICYIYHFAMSSNFIAASEELFRYLAVTLILLYGYLYREKVYDFCSALLLLVVFNDLFQIVNMILYWVNGISWAPLVPLHINVAGLDVFRFSGIVGIVTFSIMNFTAMIIIWIHNVKYRLLYIYIFALFVLLSFSFKSFVPLLLALAYFNKKNIYFFNSCLFCLVGFIFIIRFVFLGRVSLAI